jgi:hypothetical protein
VPIAVPLPLAPEPPEPAFELEPESPLALEPPVFAPLPPVSAVLPEPVLAGLQAVPASASTNASQIDPVRAAQPEGLFSTHFTEFITNLP